MKDEVFESILHSIVLPIGDLLCDGSTYRITSRDFSNIKTHYKKELMNFDKFLVVTCNQKVAGGILFYGSVDIQAIIFPEFRGKHLMSQIHKNGVLESECYPKQKVTISTEKIESFDDFLMKHYLLSCAGLKVSNVREIYEYYHMFNISADYKGFFEYSEDEFVSKFS